jgi:hypothetical protein
MKKLTVLLTMALTAFPASADWKDPNHKFDMSKLITNKTVVTIMVADNVQEACEKESRRVGNKGFNHKIQACAFWYNDSCTVILPRKASMHQAGHEFMHCILGNFHQ